MTTVSGDFTLTVDELLSRYPPASAGGGRVAQLMSSLDAALRASR